MIKLISTFIVGLICFFIVVTSIKVILILMRSFAKRGFKIPKIAKKFVFFSYAWIQDQTIFFENDQGRRSISIEKIVEIKYHYDAVNGFFEWIELIPPTGKSIIIDLEVKGMKEVLISLESHFPEVNRLQFQECINKGDFADSCTVWLKPA